MNTVTQHRVRALLVGLGLIGLGAGWGGPPVGAVRAAQPAPLDGTIPTYIVVPSATVVQATYGTVLPGLPPPTVTTGLPSATGVVASVTVGSPVPATATLLPPTGSPATATAGTACGDGAEPNNSAAQARLIPATGVVRDLTFCPAGDLDFFRLTAEAGRHYTVQTIAAGGLDPWITVTRDGQLIGQDHNLVSWDAATTGTYLIEVQNVAPENQPAARYTLTVGVTAGSGLTPTLTASPTVTAGATATALPYDDAYEPDGTAAQAQPLALNDRQIHRFCPAGDADWVQFYAARGKRYVLRTGGVGSTPAPDLDPYFNLFDSDGRTLIATDDDSGGGLDAQLEFLPLRDGVYYLQIKNKGDRGGSGAVYSLSLTTASAALTPTPTLVAYPPAPGALTPTATATVPPLLIYTPPVGPLPPSATAPASSVSSPSPPAISSLLRILPPDAGSGGLAAVQVGDALALTADPLETLGGHPNNNNWPWAMPLDVNILYRLLNLVPSGYNPALPAAGQPSDHDSYTWRAKPSDCYLLGPTNLSAGFDTTLQVWRVPGPGNPLVAPTVLATADDRQPGGVDLGATVRLCPGLDEWLVATVNLYGWDGRTDPRGKTYDFAVLVNPPTPVPTVTPRPIPTVGQLPAVTLGGTDPAPGAVAAVPTLPPTATATPPSVAVGAAQVRCGVTCVDGFLSGATTTAACTSHGGVASWLLCPVPTAVLAALTGATAPGPAGSSGLGGRPPALTTVAGPRGPGASGPPTITPTGTPAGPPPSPSPTATPPPAFLVELILYRDNNKSGHPNAGEGIGGLTVQRRDRRNRLVQSARTDANGYVAVQWTGDPTSQIDVPQLGWNRSLSSADFGPPDAAGIRPWKDNGTTDGEWGVDVQPLPAVIP